MTEVSTTLRIKSVKQFCAWVMAICMALVLIPCGTIMAADNYNYGYLRIEGDTGCVTSGDGTTYGNGGLAHHYTSAPAFSWAKDGKSCTAIFECFYEDSTSTVDCTVTSQVKKAATCTKKGITVYTATVVMEGKTYTSTKQLTDIPAEHSYKTVTTKATPTANGKIVKTCSKCGKVVKTTIYKASDIKLSKDSYVYNGEYKIPTVTVKDSKGNVIDSSAYTVSYSNNKNAGIAAVTVKFSSKLYKGTISKEYTIAPAATKISKAMAKGTGFKLTWKKQTKQVDGYQIQYSTNSKFNSAKSITVSDNATTSYVAKDLKAGKQYYVKIRTYKVVDGKKVFSAWSAPKTVTVSK